MSERDEILKAWVKRRDVGITQVGECKHLLNVIQGLIEGDRSHNEAIAGDLSHQLRQIRTQLAGINHQLKEEPPHDGPTTDSAAPYLT